MVRCSQLPQKAVILGMIRVSIVRIDVIPSRVPRIFSIRDCVYIQISDKDGVKYTSMHSGICSTRIHVILHIFEKKVIKVGFVYTADKYWAGNGEDRQ